MKTNLSFINNIIENNIRASQVERDALMSNEVVFKAYLTGAIEALEKTREQIKQFIKELNTLTEHELRNK